jgi:hypothetical protein
VRDHEPFPDEDDKRRPTLDEYLPLIGLELRRARRYERGLSALTLDAAAFPKLPRGRATDIVAVCDGRVLIVLPEAGPTDAAHCAERLERATGFAPLAAASFPEDALTMDTLLQLVLED